MTVLFDLPSDITHLLFCYLDIHDVLNMRQTCKKIRLVTQSRVIWQALLTSLAKQQIPIPCLFGRPFDSLSSAELEYLARKAWALRKNWLNKSPVARKTLTMKLDPIPYQDGRVPPSFTFIENAGKGYMLTVKGHTPEGSVLDLQCWDLELSPPRCVAERRISRRYLAVNKNSGSLASLAVLSPSIELLGIDYSADDPSSGFYTVSKFQNSTERPVALSDSLLVIQNDRQQLYFSRIHKDNDNYIELRSEQPSGPVLKVMIQDEVIIVIRRRTLEMFSIGDFVINQRAIYPITRYIFQWNLDSVSLSPQRTWPRRSKDRYPVLNILIRFAGILPWPVNLLHHFILLPNPGVDINSPLSPNNFPYSDTPVIKRAIGSPVRLFAKYHMTMGSRGTAIFIDSHAEDYFGRGDIGQRLAGSYARVIPTDEGDELLHLQEDSTEVVESTMDSSVFGYRENDDWTRIAVDEEEGRIAVGFSDGTIEIREYA